MSATIQPVDDQPLRHTLTIEQLAAETGLTVRNIRSHRARNLLQPPVVRDQIGYYGPEHVNRLKLIRQLQAEGFNLTAIKRLIERAPQAADSLLSTMQLVTEPFETEEPKVVSAAELSRRFRIDDPATAVLHATELGILLPVGDGAFEAPIPSLLDVAEELVALGVPLRHSLTVVKKVRDSCRVVAREFIRLFVEDVFRPFQAAGLPEERWPELLVAIERLRPMSAQVVLGVYQLTMGAEVEQAAAHELKQLFKHTSR